MSGSILYPGGGFDFSSAGASQPRESLNFPTASQGGGFDFVGLSNAFGNAAGGLSQLVAAFKGNARTDGNADDLATVNDRATGNYPAQYQQPSVQVPGWMLVFGALALGGLVVWAVKG